LNQSGKGDGTRVVWPSILTSKETPQMPQAQLYQVHRQNQVKLSVSYHQIAQVDFGGQSCQQYQRPCGAAADTQPENHVINATSTDAGRPGKFDMASSDATQRCIASGSQSGCGIQPCERPLRCRCSGSKWLRRAQLSGNCGQIRRLNCGRAGAEASQATSEEEWKTENGARRG
jgi:hypothetical protein